MVTYKGVHKVDEDRYEARIFKEGRETRIGVYTSDVEAALAYDLTAEAALGDIARLNFPDVVEADNAPAPLTQTPTGV